MPDVSSDAASTKRQSRAAQGNAYVSSIMKGIEEGYRLPEGSVVICKRDGTAFKANTRIRAVRKHWG